MQMHMPIDNWKQWNSCFPYVKLQINNHLKLIFKKRNNLQKAGC